jgi:ATP-binding cassette subfamily B protein
MNSGLFGFQIASVRQIVSFVGRRTIFWGSATVLTGLVTFGLDLAFAIVLQRFLISVGLIAGGSSPTLLPIIQSPFVEAGLFLLLGVFRGGAIWCNGVANGFCHVSFESKARQNVVRWALQSGKAPLGQVSTLFNDVAIGAAATVANLFYVLSRAVLILATLTALGVYSWQMTALLLLALVIAIPIHRVIDRRMSGVSSIIQKSLADVTARVLTGVKNSVFLQIHGLVGEEVRRSEAAVDAYNMASRRYFLLSGSRTTIPQLVGLIVAICVVIEGAYFFGDNKSHIVTYLYLAIRFFQSMSEIGRISSNLRLNWPRLRVLHRWWFKEFEPAIRHKGRDVGIARNAISLKGLVGWNCDGVSFGWDGDAPLVENASFNIRPGSMTVAVGHSGVGKTTFILLLAGLIEPSRGAVGLVGSDGKMDIELKRENLLASVAYVGPDPFVVPGTIRTNLALGVPVPPSDDELHEALRLSHCEFVDEMPLGLDHNISEQGGGLSAGQKQRLAIARALLRRPQVLFLDEATAHLDSEAEQVILTTLRELKGTMTIVAITHRKALQTIADQTLVFKNNSIEVLTSSQTRTIALAE